MNISFHESTSNETKSFFRDCVPLAEKLQEISHALKGEIDRQYYEEVKDLKKGPVEDEFNTTFTVETVATLNKTSLSSNDQQCDRRFEREFGKGLSSKTIFCHHAIRPIDPFLSKYLDLVESDKPNADTDFDYHLSPICLHGKRNLEDWARTAETDPDAYHDLSRDAESFHIIVVVLLILFFPVIVLKLVPWEDDKDKPVLNIITEEAKHYIFEGEDEEEIMGVQECDCPSSMPSLESGGRDQLGCTVLVDGNLKTAATVTIVGKKGQKEKWSRKNAFKLLFSRTREAEVMEWLWNDKSVDEANPTNGDKNVSQGMEKREKPSGTNLFGTGIDGHKNMENGSVAQNGTLDVNQSMDELKRIKANYNFIALDASTPRIFGFMSLLMGKVPPIFGPTGVAILTTIRKFLVIILTSCSAILLMGILDYIFYKETVSKLLQFQKENRVEVLDLYFWNQLTAIIEGTQSFGEVNSFRIFYAEFILFACVGCYWILTVLIFSLPGVSSLCVQLIHPSDFFGFFQIMTYPTRHTSGLRLLFVRITRRLGLMLNTGFWRMFVSQVFGPDKISGKRSPRKILKGIVSLFCVFSFFPIFAILPPLYSWSREYWPKKALFFVMNLISGAIWAFLVIVSLQFYLQFFIFSITAMIFHYESAIGIISLVVGCFGFLFSIYSQINNAYLRDKLFILEVVRDVHGAKMGENEEAKSRIQKYNEENPSSIILVPEVLWWWKRGHWDCIPKSLYRAIVQELRPLGNQRANTLIKLCMMGIFVAFIFSVMQALGMNDAHSAADGGQVVITIVAVIGPSIIARFRSGEAKTLNLMQKRGKIKEVVEKFLRNNNTFYNYDFDIKLMSERGKTEQASF